MGTKAELQGVVISDKMDQSVVVAVERRVRHELYGKIQRRTSKFMAHDPANDANRRVANTAVTYTAVPSVSVGTGVATPSVGTLALGATVAYVGTGSNTVTWNPTLTMVLSPTQVAGTYKGTVTHSVS